MLCANCGARWELSTQNRPVEEAKHCPFCGLSTVRVDNRQPSKEDQTKAVQEAARRGYEEGQDPSPKVEEAAKQTREDRKSKEPKSKAPSTPDDPLSSGKKG